MRQKLIKLSAWIILAIISFWIFAETTSYASAALIIISVLGTLRNIIKISEI